MYMSYVLDLKEKIMEGMNTEPSQQRLKRDRKIDVAFVITAIKYTV